MYIIEYILCVRNKMKYKIRKSNMVFVIPMVISGQFIYTDVTHANEDITPPPTEIRETANSETNSDNSIQPSERDTIIEENIRDGNEDDKNDESEKAMKLFLDNVVVDLPDNQFMYDRSKTEQENSDEFWRIALLSRADNGEMTSEFINEIKNYMVEFNHTNKSVSLTFDVPGPKNEYYQRTFKFVMNYIPDSFDDIKNYLNLEFEAESISTNEANVRTEVTMRGDHRDANVYLEFESRREDNPSVILEHKTYDFGKYNISYVNVDNESNEHNESTDKYNAFVKLQELINYWNNVNNFLNPNRLTEYNNFKKLTERDQKNFLLSQLSEYERELLKDSSYSEFGYKTENRLTRQLVGHLPSGQYVSIPAVVNIGNNNTDKDIYVNHIVRLREIGTDRIYYEKNARTLIPATVINVPMEVANVSMSLSNWEFNNANNAVVGAKEDNKVKERDTIYYNASVDLRKLLTANDDTNTKSERLLLKGDYKVRVYYDTSLFSSESDPNHLGYVDTDISKKDIYSTNMYVGNVLDLKYLHDNDDVPNTDLRIEVLKGEEIVATNTYNHKNHWKLHETGPIVEPPGEYSWFYSYSDISEAGGNRYPFFDMNEVGVELGNDNRITNVATMDASGNDIIAVDKFYIGTPYRKDGNIDYTSLTLTVDPRISGEADIVAIKKDGSRVTLGKVKDFNKQSYNVELSNKVINYKDKTYTDSIVNNIINNMDIGLFNITEVSDESSPLLNDLGAFTNDRKDNRDINTPKVTTDIEALLNFRIPKYNTIDFDNYNDEISERTNNNIASTIVESFDLDKTMMTMFLISGETANVAYNTFSSYPNTEDKLIISVNDYLKRINDFTFKYIYVDESDESSPHYTYDPIGEPVGYHTFLGDKRVLAYHVDRVSKAGYDLTTKLSDIIDDYLKKIKYHHFDENDKYNPFGVLNKDEKYGTISGNKTLTERPVISITEKNVSGVEIILPHTTVFKSKQLWGRNYDRNEWNNDYLMINTLSMTIDPDTIVRHGLEYNDRFNNLYMYDKTNGYDGSYRANSHAYGKLVKPINSREESLDFYPILEQDGKLYDFMRDYNTDNDIHTNSDGNGHGMRGKSDGIMWVNIIGNDIENLPEHHAHNARNTNNRMLLGESSDYSFTTSSLYLNKDDFKTSKIWFAVPQDINIEIKSVTMRSRIEEDGGMSDSNKSSSIIIDPSRFKKVGTRTFEKYGAFDVYELEWDPALTPYNRTFDAYRGVLSYKQTVYENAYDVTFTMTPSNTFTTANIEGDTMRYPVFSGNRHVSFADGTVTEISNKDNPLWYELRIPQNYLIYDLVKGSEGEYVRASSNNAFGSNVDVRIHLNNANGLMDYEKTEVVHAIKKNGDWVETLVAVPSKPGWLLSFTTDTTPPNDSGSNLEGWSVPVENSPYDPNIVALNPSLLEEMKKITGIKWISKPETIVRRGDIITYDYTLNIPIDSEIKRTTRQTPAVSFNHNRFLDGYRASIETIGGGRVYIHYHTVDELGSVRLHDTEVLEGLETSAFNTVPLRHRTLIKDGKKYYLVPELMPLNEQGQFEKYDQHVYYKYILVKESKPNTYPTYELPEIHFGKPNTYPMYELPEIHFGKPNTYPMYELPEIHFDKPNTYPTYELPEIHFNKPNTYPKYELPEINFEVPNTYPKYELPEIHFNKPNTYPMYELPEIHFNKPNTYPKYELPEIHFNKPNTYPKYELPEIHFDKPNTYPMYELPEIHFNKPNTYPKYELPEIHFNKPNTYPMYELPEIHFGKPNTYPKYELPEIHFDKPNTYPMYELPEIHFNKPNTYPMYELPEIHFDKPNTYPKYELPEIHFNKPNTYPMYELPEIHFNKPNTYPKYELPEIHFGKPNTYPKYELPEIHFNKPNTYPTIDKPSINFKVPNTYPTYELPEINFEIPKTYPKHELPEIELEEHESEEHNKLPKTGNDDINYLYGVLLTLLSAIGIKKKSKTN